MSAIPHPNESLQSLAASLNSRERSTLERAAARMSPAHYAVIASNGKWVPAPHLRLINQLLIWLDQRLIDRLVVTLGPRHGKSEFISKYFNAWTLGRKPDHRHILASYEAEFASEWGRKARDLLDENGQRLFDVKVRQDSKAADHWMIHDHLGGMQTCGVGGPLTGKGADCLPAGMMIETQKGPVDIAELVWSNSRINVLAYDHANQQAVWRPIIASRSLVADELYEIETVGGRKIRSTGDHRIFVVGRGYIPASMVAVADRLVVQNGPDVQGVPSLSRNEAHGGRYLPGMLRKDAANKGSSQMPVLRQGIRETDRGIQKATRKKAGRRVLLRPRMLKGSPRRKERREVQGLRKTKDKSVLVLLRGMQVGGTGGTKTASSLLQVHSVQQRLHASSRKESVLRTRLCERRSLRTHDRNRKFPVQECEQLCQVVSHAKDANPQSGRLSVRRLRRLGTTQDVRSLVEGPVSVVLHDSPHQRKSFGQPDRESCDALPRVPHDSPQISQDTVSVVRRVREPGVRVYDIQVEGCHNFFVGKTLCHNCLIIDDPFKNMEEAVSTTIRDKKMDWFRTAAYTRLEPTGAMIMIATRWHEADITGTVLAEMKEGGDQWTYLHLPSLHKSKEVWADLTIPGEHAERIKAYEGMTFRQLQAFLDHCQAVA